MYVMPANADFLFFFAQELSSLKNAYFVVQAQRFLLFVTVTKLPKLDLEEGMQEMAFRSCG